MGNCGRWGAGWFSGRTGGQPDIRYRWDTAPFADARRGRNPVFCLWKRNLPSYHRRESGGTGSGRFAQFHGESLLWHDRRCVVGGWCIFDSIWQRGIDAVYLWPQHTCGTGNTAKGIQPDRKRPAADSDFYLPVRAPGGVYSIRHWNKRKRGGYQGRCLEKAEYGNSSGEGAGFLFARRYAHGFLCGKRGTDGFDPIFGRERRG